MCLTIILFQTVEYSVSPMTTKSSLYSLDLNLNHNASWKKESTWFDSADQSIGMSARNIHDYRLELVSKELNHLAAILHVYAGGLNFMK